MEFVFLGIVFLAMILMLAFKRPLYQSLLAAMAATALLYRIPVPALFTQTLKVFSNWDSLSVLISLYLITYLQRMLDRRGQIKLAQTDLNGLFHNRRINAAGAAMFIGLLPSAAATILSGDIVKDASDGYLEPRDQAFVTSWFRHIPESTLPTYSGVLLMTSLSGVAVRDFLPGMLVPIITLTLLGYISALRKLPKDPGMPPSENRLRDAANLFRHLWTLPLILVLILVFGIQVVPAVGLTLVAAALVYRFKLSELVPMLRSAFDVNLLLNTFLVLVLKEFIGYTGVLELLPGLLSRLPIPAYLIFALMFFLGGIISGTNGIIALGTPLAFAALEGGMPLMVLLMCMCHAASQISPTHVCIVVAADYYHISLGQLIKKTLPVSLAFCVLMIAYYNILILI